MARSIEMQNPEVRKLWWITLVVQVTFGFTAGLYLYTFGLYFYEKFGGSASPSMAMLLTTALMGFSQGLIALLEFPTGALADTIGRAQIIIMSWIMRVIFFLALAFIWLCHTPATSFAWALIACTAFAFNYTFFNGAFAAWCADVLREKAPDTQYSWLASRFYSYRNFMVMLGAMCGILLYAFHMAYVAFILAAFLSFCAMGYSMIAMKEVRSLSFVETRHAQWSTITKRVGEIIGKSSQICIKSPVIFWVVLTFGSYMFLLNLVKYLWPVYFQSVAGDQAHYTRNWILIAVSSEFLAFLGSRCLVSLNKRWSKNLRAHLTAYRRIYTVVTLASAAAVITFSACSAHLIHITGIFPIAVIVVCIAYGFVAPCHEILVNAYLPPEDAQNRATVLSAGSMLRSVLVLILAIPSGGDSGANSPIYWAIPATLLLISSIAAHLSMKKAAKRRLAEEEASAAQGVSA